MMNSFFEVEQTEANKEQENTSDETNIPIFFQSNVGNEIEEVNLVYETINKAVLDCGASRTVCGSEWFSIYLDSIPEKERNEIIEKPSNTMFKFGVGMLRASKRVIIPVTMCEKKVNLEVDIVDTDIPLLISNPTMKKLGMNVNFQDDKMDMGGRQFNLDTASTGHYTVPLFEPKDVSYINFAMCEILTAESQIDTGSAEKKALKLHRRFAHASSARIIKLLKNADMADKDVFKELEALDTKCDFCLRHKRAAPRPTVSLPLAYEFNELVTMDLKQIDGVWILHCCDYVTRFSAGHVIKNKEAEEVMEKLFICWISVFGPMRKLLTDNGGEFVNDDWKELCSTFNILHKDTASEAAFQNGICERHNDLIGHMTSKMKEDVGCNPQISLMWALHAKNSLISVLGFSPYQLVFGKNPNIPGNSTNNLPAMSSYTTSQTVADHINSLRMAREAYIKAENADRVKRAMRGRVYAGTHQRFFSGDVIYYKKNGYKGWFGPGKVLGQDGAQVLVKSGARTLIKLHPCKMILKETAERQMDSKDEVNENHEEAPVELKKPDDDVTNSDESDSDSEDDDINRSTQPDLTVSPQEQSKESTEEVKEAETEDSTPRISACLDEEAETEDSTPRIRSETEDNTPRTRSRSKPNHLMNKGDVIFIKETEESTWMKCTIIERDGVLGTSWKVTNKDKDRFCVDLDKVTWIRAKDEIPKEADAVMFADQLHLEFALLNFSKPQNSEEEEAIAKEIEQWRKFDVYEEVDRRTFPDQEIIDCRWVINEKKKPEGTVVKARLVVKGFQESNSPLADSPTASKSVARLFIVLANVLKFTFTSLDVRAAFLQSEPLSRLLLVKPPKQYRKDENMVWRLKKPVYGLVDGARSWFLTVKKELLEYGCTQLELDNSVYVYHSNGKLSGFLIIHVDDFLAAGDSEFKENVVVRLKTRFQIGSEKEGDFTYVGWNIKQSSGCITIDQISYQNTITPIAITEARKQQHDFFLSDIEKKQYQQLLGKLQWITSQSRPDLRFRTLECSIKAAKPLVRDLQNINSVVKKLKQRTVTIMYPSFSKDTSKLMIYAYADASLNNLPGKTASTRGYAIFIVSDQNVGIVSWGSRKIKKVAKTIIYAEGLALSACLDEAVLIRKVVITALCLSNDSVPVIGLCDNESLVENIYSSHQAEDLKLRVEVASLRQQIQHEEIKDIVWIPDPIQLADCLTKTAKTKNPVDNLLQVIQSGNLDFTPRLS